MTIGRMQMNRQLYGLGSYFPPENGREKFGLGSKLKKFVRNIIPNEVADIAVKAAPFVAPFNPLLAGYMAGIGGFDQTGSIGSSLKRGLLTYGGGQLARGIGGAGFQQGFNPFSNVSFSGGIMSGLGQTFTSPVSGAPMFGQAQFAADPNQLTQAQTYLQDQAATNLGSTTDVVKQLSQTPAQSRGYMDIAKDLFSGDFTKMGSAATELGGKALKDIYTNPITNKEGDIVGSKLDKTALLATLVTIPSYLDAKKAADEAGLEEFDEAAYNAERDKYMSKYQGNLPASSFGIESKANGGRIGYGDGTKPSAEENTPSQEIINRRIAQIKDMSKRGADIDTIKSITGASDQMIKDVLGQANGGRIGYEQGTPREGIVSLTDEDSGVIYRDPDTEEPITKEEFLRRTQEDEDKQYMSPTDQGSGVIYRNEKGEPITKNEWLRLTSEAPSITLPEKETKGMKKSNYESDPYLLQLMRKTGEDVFFFGEPNPELNYREFDKMPMDYQNKVEDKREGRRRFYQKYDYKQAPRYERMGYAMGSEVPVRRNEGGITELDYRNTGGFVPIGVKEKADDVPAMLSKNEFVFTADAVRAAGGGSVQKGAQKMYNTMKMLEGKLV
jgi:hypothetical protein